MVCCFLLLVSLVLLDYLVSLVTLFLLNSEQVCDPAGIQTQDLQNRNLTLYSAKLQGLLVGMRLQEETRFASLACRASSS